jgi:hypothetical protein
MANSGIDYGMGRTNVDMGNGIRYGFLPANGLASHAWDTIRNDGEDLDYTEAIENLKDELARVIKNTVEDYDSHFDCKQAAEDIVDSMEFNLESSGDCARYKYESKGLEFSTLSDGDLVVTKSPYFTYCAFAHLAPLVAVTSSLRGLYGPTVLDRNGLTKIPPSPTPATEWQTATLYPLTTTCIHKTVWS